MSIVNLITMPKFIRRPFGAILMLHRIDDISHERIWYNEHLKVSTEFLEQYIRYAQNMGFTFISLDELCEIIRLKKRRYRKLIAITMDDGYRDNFSHGLPLFQSLTIPFCVYVATAMTQKQMLYWWYILEDIILKHNEITLSTGQHFLCHSSKQKEQTFLEIRSIILHLPQKNISYEFLSLLNKYDIDTMSYNNTLSLTWAQLNEMSKDPLCTIGCHTHTMRCHLVMRMT